MSTNSAIIVTKVCNYAHALKNARDFYRDYPEQHRIDAKVDGLIALCDRPTARFQSAQATQLHLAYTHVEAAIY